MKQATINAPLGYKCSPTGKWLETFPVGATVTGQVAEWAVQDGAAVWTHDPREETKVEAPTEFKMPVPGPQVPSDWRDMSWPDMRSLAASLTDDPIRNKADAIAAIEAANG